MKKSYIIIIAIVALIVIAVMSYSSAYNKLVGLEENVKASWSQVENVYQRRMDLIPNLVNTVKGYANFEKETLTAVIEARANATKTSINVNDAQDFAKFQQNQGALSSALSRLMVVSEQYPNLKADVQFTNLQAELSGTENRIAVERNRFNETARVFNTEIRGFFTQIIANSMGLAQKPYFEADKNASVAPKVEF
jgi:LemA protein